MQFSNYLLMSANFGGVDSNAGRGASIGLGQEVSDRAVTTRTFRPDRDAPPENPLTPGFANTFYRDSLCRAKRSIASHP